MADRLEAPPRRAFGGLVRRIATSTTLELAGVLSVSTALAELFRTALSTANIALLYLTAVAIIGIRRGVRPALTASVAGLAAMSFFHAEPRFSLRDGRAEDWVTFACFAVMSLVTGNLAGRFRRQLDETRSVAERNERLYEISRSLAVESRGEGIVQVVRRAVADAVGGETLLLLEQADGELAPAHALDAPLEPVDRAAAEAAYTKLRVAGRGTDLFGESAWYFLPLQGDRKALGVLALRPAPNARPVETEKARLLVALCHLAAVALDRHRLAEEMRAAHLLTETEKLRAALLSSVSHDLRTPLASIIGAASTLEDFSDALPPEDQRELLATVLSESLRLNRFVGNLLDMTRIEYGGLALRPAWCDLRDLIAEATRGLQSVLGPRTLALEVSDDFPLLFVDAVLLERVLENLIDNAAKYSSAEAPLRLTAHTEPGHAVLRLIDRGPGIPREQREAVFTLFHRVREADKREAGTGLGLAICRGLVEALGGAISLEDGPDAKGLCVEVRVPLGHASDPAREA